MTLNKLEKVFKVITSFVLAIISLFFLEDIFTWKFVYNLSFNSFLSNFVYKFSNFENFYMVFSVILVLFLLVSILFAGWYFFNCLLVKFNVVSKNFLCTELKNIKNSYKIIFYILGSLIFFDFLILLIFSINTSYYFIYIFLFLCVYIVSILYFYFLVHINISAIVFLIIINAIFLIAFCLNDRNFLFIIFTSVLYILLYYFNSLIIEIYCNLDKMKFTVKPLIVLYITSFFVFGIMNYFNKVKENDFSLNLFFNNLFISKTPYPNYVKLPKYWKTYINENKICGISEFNKTKLNLSNIPNLPINSNEKLFFYKISKHSTLVILLEEIIPKYQIVLKNDKVLNSFIENHSSVYRILDIGCIKN